MAPADALSRQDSLDTSLDNADVTICSELVVINTLDLALTCHIWSSSQSDPLVLRAIKSLQKGSPLFPCSLLNNWKFENEHLYFKGHMYVPPEFHHAFVASLHYSIILGHAGQFHIRTFLERDFWWPGLSTYVNNFIAGYATCQQNKINTHPTCVSLNPISSSSLSFKQLSVDLVTDLPPAQGFDLLMVVVNHGLMKGVVIIPCSKTINAVEMERLFFQNIFKQFGLHNSIISNQGPQFASALARELAQLLKYDVQLSTAYHPQTDGQTERTNQEIETYLCIFCTNNPHSWPDLLPTTEFLHNTTPHHSTKVSPFSLLLRYIPQAYPPLGKTFLPALENCMVTLKEARKEALAAHKTAQWIMREQITRNFSPWKVGDKMWLEATNLCLHYPSQKLAPKRLGPFKLSQVLSLLMYRLRLPSTWTQLLFTTSWPDWIWRRIWSGMHHIPPQTSWKMPVPNHMEGVLSSENTQEPKSNLKHTTQLLIKYKNFHHLSLLEHALHPPAWCSISIPHPRRHPLDSWTHHIPAQIPLTQQPPSWTHPNPFLLLHHSWLSHPQLNPGSSISLWVPP